MNPLVAPTESASCPSRRSRWATWLFSGLLLVLFWSMLCTVPGIPWNAARLAPSFALARGLPVYALRDSGAHLGWVYGPVFPLWFFPAGLTDNPTIGLMEAAVLNLVALVVPLFVVFRVVLRRGLSVTIPLVVLGVALLLSNPITNAAFYIIHVDGLCIGWALIACSALWARAVTNWRPGFIVAAFALALSVATKQVAVVLVPATLVWLWAEGQRKLLWSWIFWLAVICGGLAVVFFVAFGPEELLFNAWLLFSRMPWKGGWGMLGANLLEVVQSCWLWCVAGFLGWLVLRRKDLRPPADAASFARLLGWIALIQAPMGLTASLLVDAALNSIHSPTYLLVAGLVLTGSVLANPSESVNLPSRDRVWGGIWAVTAAGVCAGFYLGFNRPAVWKPFRGQEEMLVMVRQSHGRIYLPWNPLITIIADRKIYPFDEALHYLWLARLEPPRAAIKAAVPEGAFVIYHEPCQSHFALNYFGKGRSESEFQP